MLHTSVPLAAIVLMASADTDRPSTMKRILCLHGRNQSGAIMHNKIGGARRKLERKYVLDFLDGPLQIPGDADSDGATGVKRSWWEKDARGRHVHVRNAFDYVARETDGKEYDALIGFSQGGILATGLALSTTVPGNIQAVVTAGAPMVDEVFRVAAEISRLDHDGSSETVLKGRQIPKLHLAGRTDSMVPVESTERLCHRGGNGQLVVHDKGHLFPTKAEFVNQIIQFLDERIT